jgi:hypothetical protein
MQPVSPLDFPAMVCKASKPVTHDIVGFKR